MSRILDETAHARTRDRILDAARSLFASEGFHAASMNDVAKACELTKASLYHYFESKQAILEGLHEQLVREAEAHIQRFPRFNSLPEALLAAGRQYLEHFKDPRHRQMMQLTFKLGLHDPDPTVRFDKQRLDEQLLGLFIPYLPAGTPVEKARLFAQQFFGSLFFYVFAAEQLCPIGSLCEPQVYLEQLVQIFAADPLAALKGAS
jgi:AcrR family transcriptional regulator